MAEECKEPTRIFPKVLLAGLFITGAIYVLVSISAITLVPPEQLGEGETPLLKVVQAGAPNFPLWIFGFITMFAVANSALINMLMASRLVYGMSREHVLPAALGKVHASRRTPYIAIGFTTLLAFALITFVGEVPAARRHHGAAAAVRVHGGQHRRAGAAPRPGRHTAISARRPSCRSSARCPAPSSSARGPAAIRCSTRSPASCSASGSCSGSSPCSSTARPASSRSIRPWKTSAAPARRTDGAPLRGFRSLPRKRQSRNAALLGSCLRGNERSKHF